MEFCMQKDALLISSPIDRRPQIDLIRSHFLRSLQKKYGFWKKGVELRDLISCEKLAGFSATGFIKVASLIKLITFHHLFQSRARFPPNQPLETVFEFPGTCNKQPSIPVRSRMITPKSLSFSSRLMQAEIGYYFPLLDISPRTTTSTRQSLSLSLVVIFLLSDYESFIILYHLTWVSQDETSMRCTCLLVAWLLW